MERGIRHSFLQRGGGRPSRRAEPIRQVLLNLGLNAMDAMPQGGTLSVRLYAEDRQIRIELKDTGGGIPRICCPQSICPSSRPKERAWPRPSKAYAIIEEHGGSISCSSTVGEGPYLPCLNR